MKKKSIVKSIVSVILSATMAFSIVPFATISSSAAGLGSDSFADWRAWEFYSRAFGTAGSIMESLGEATGNESVAQFTSFINNTFCGGSETDEQLAQLQETCEEILDTTKKVESITTEINSKLANEKITVSKKECDDAWNNQVMDYITKNDESPYDFYNAYIAYRDYLKYASNPETIPTDKSIEYYEDEFMNSLVDYYAGKTNTSKATEAMLYTDTTIDVCITGMIKSMLNTMDPETTSVGMGNRFIDEAAQYAYYAYPYSSEQAEFVDKAAEYQINTVTYLVMLYQDFCAHRAEYFESNNMQSEWSDYNKYYENLIKKYTSTMENFLHGDIYLSEVDAYTTLDKYVREDSATVYYDEESDSFTLKNDKFKTFVKHPNPNYGSANHTTQQYMSFNKNASVTVENGNLEFTPFYVLDGSDLEMYRLMLQDFDEKFKNTHGGPMELFDSHYLSCDYFNFANGVFSDGVNKYVPVSDPEQLKSIVNETYYTAHNHTPYTYFSSLIGYGSSDNPVYLLLGGKSGLDKKTLGTDYAYFPVFNMMSTNSYATDWTSEKMSLYNLQDDRDDDENKTNSMYTVILVPQSNEIRSKVDTKVIGEGEVTVSGLSNGTALSGDTVDVKITVPENQYISSVKVQYHNDPSDLSKVTEERVIGGEFEGNELSLTYPVPYSNVTIVVETKEYPDALVVNENGSYVVSSYDDLCQMRDMVNSGYPKYVNGSYVLTNDIDCKGQPWTTTIGTDTIQFNGTFDGRNHTIKNLNVESGVGDGSRQGLFAVLDDKAVVKNLNVDNASVFSSESPVKGSGVIAKQNNGTILNCKVTNSSVQLGNWHYLGGITGLNNGTIENCSVENSHLTRRWGGSSSHTMGGITEENNGTVKNCYTYNCTFNNGTENNGPIISRGNSPENCYYYTTSNVNKTYGTEKTSEQFESGEIETLVKGV